MENNIYKKLLEVQNKLKAPKGQRNTFGNYNFRSCEDILEAVKPLLKEQGLILILQDNVEVQNQRYYIKATAKLIDVESGNSLETTASARESEIKKGMDDSQITGTASSYARKYALNGLFCIDDTKDADTNEYANTTRPTTEIKTKEQAENYKLSFGKYAGTTLKEIVATNKEYANWLYQKGDDTVKHCLNLMLGK